jgi:PAS domain S-box-containing protein
MAAQSFETEHREGSRLRLENGLSQGSYRQILDVLGEGVLLVDDKETIRFCNPACERIFEMSSDELVGKSLLDFVDDADKVRLVAETRKRIEGITSRYDLTITSARGNRRQLLATASPLVKPDGRYEGAVGTILDVTDIRSTERELRQVADALARSNELKELFADILRHDLLGPVTVVKAYVETLLENDAAPLKEFLGIILENSNKLVGIIEGAADLAKLEARGELEKSPTHIYELVNEATQSLQEAASEKGLSLSLSGDDEVLVNANPVLREVFWNLISNAIKYCPSNSPVNVEVEFREGDVVVSVRDSGEGVPDEAKQAIFERFKRASRGSVKGSGLGLAIAKRIVELHGGQIWVEDNPEGGAVFSVSLPSSSAETASS